MYEETKWEFYKHRPIGGVIHCAGFNGGIEFNRQFPADIFYNNTVMGLNVIDMCRQFEVPKVLSVVASCAYPEYIYEGGECKLNDEMYADEFLDLPPNDTVACHGYAKRNLQLASQFYAQQYGLRATTACITTMYGPGDSFHPMRTKVLGALIAKFTNAAIEEHESVTLWGTGSAKREFIYVDDAAEALVRSFGGPYEDSTKPINIGTGFEYSIKELANMIAKIIGYKGKILWDESKPDGQLRKRLYMDSDIGFSLTPMEQGIEETIRYYITNVYGKAQDETGIRNSRPGTKSISI